MFRLSKEQKILLFRQEVGDGLSQVWYSIAALSMSEETQERFYLSQLITPFGDVRDDLDALLSGLIELQQAKVGLSEKWPMH